MKGGTSQRNGDGCRRGHGAACWLGAVLLLGGACGAAAQTKAPDDLARARALLGTPRWHEADALAKQYVAEHPDSADGHALLGLVLYREHQPRASMAEILKASELAELTAFDLRIFALDCAAIPDLPEAERWLLRSIEKDDKDAGTWEALGHVRFAQQKYKDAIEALNRALELAPRTVASEALIGLAYERQAQPEAAETAYRTAIAWQADGKEKDPVPYVGLGRVLLGNDQAAAAAPWLEEAVKAPAATSEAHELLGQAYAKTGRNAEAAKELETAIRMDPEAARLHLMISRVYRALGEAEKARAEQERYAAMKASAAQ